MRIPFASSLKSRDGTLDQDAKVVNGIVEPDGDAAPTVRRRPGLTDLGLVRAGAAQLLYYWNSKVRTIIGDYISDTNSPSELVQTTWNSADKDADVALSNGDLTITVSNGGFARSVLPCTSGVWAWQITVATATGTVCVGMANSSATFVQLGASADSIAYSSSSGQISKNSSVLATVATYTVGDVIKVVYDFDATTIKFYKNGTLVYTASGSNVPSGTLYAAAGANSAGSVVHTVNFDATSTSANISPTSAGELFSAQDNGANSPEALLMIKNSSQAWTIDTADTVTQITDTDYPGKYTVTLSSLTRSSTTATASTQIPTNFQVGSSVTIAGVNEAGWNGAYTITGVTAQTETPATAPIKVGITRSGTTATATVTDGSAHGYTTGNTVTISDAGQDGYNGDKTITVTSSTAFTFSVTETVPAIVSPATVQTGYTVPAGYVVERSGSAAFSADGSVCTVTMPNHGYSTGKVLSIAAYGTLTICSSAAITVVDADTFTVSVTAANRPLVAGQYGIGVQTWATTPAITSITGSGTTATINFGSAHGLVAQERFVVLGCAQSYYNTGSAGTSFIITSTTAVTYTIGAVVSEPASPGTPVGQISASRKGSTTDASFTFTVDGTETTPATGTITAQSGRTTVPGIAYLNGYFVVMDEQGVIYNSAQDDPENWNALEFTSALNEPGAGVAIAKSGNYIAAFKEWSTEFFYDAQNPTESPLSPVDNGFTLIGCAQGWSVANVDGSLMWVAQSKKHKGRQIYRMIGTEQAKVSTPDVERVLNADTLATVYAWGARIDGHPCYVLSLVTSDVTLVYDTVSGAWYQWTSLTLGSSKAISSITRSGTTATVTFGAAHGLSDGDPLTISGATQSGYNGLHQVKYVSTTVVTVEVDSATVSPATGTILGYPYTESYFKLTHYAAADGVDVVLHVSDGHLYEIDPDEALDDGVPVNYFIRTARLDGGSTGLKKVGSLRVIGEKVSDTAVMRWSDDDCSTFTKYRDVDLSAKQPELRRCGSFRRRSFEFRHAGDSLPRVTEIEIGE